MYKSIPRAIIITLGNNLYRIPKVVLPPIISLTTGKQRSKIVSQTRKFIFLTTHSQGKNNIGATTSKQGSPLRLQQMDKFMEEYEDIFSSLPEVPLHCQDKHSIDLTLNHHHLMLPYILQVHIQNPNMYCLRLIKKPNLLNASSMSTHRSMISSTNPSSTEFSSSQGGSQRKGDHCFLRREE